MPRVGPCPPSPPLPPPPIGLLACFAGLVKQRLLSYALTITVLSGWGAENSYASPSAAS